MQRFWSKAEVGDPHECWPWVRAMNRYGYGKFGMPPVESGGKWTTVGAHRIAYELTRGEIPDGLQIDHLCRVRHCVNPFHMEPVTLVENVRRGMAGHACGPQKTHCLRGHERTPDNLDKKRSCRTCQKLRKRRVRSEARLH